MAGRWCAAGRWCLFAALHLLGTFPESSSAPSLGAAPAPAPHPAAEEWAVEVRGGVAAADHVARELGFVNLGAVGHAVVDVYRFRRHGCTGKGCGRLRRSSKESFGAHAQVSWAERQVLLRRTRRAGAPRDGAGAARDDANVTLARARARRAAGYVGTIEDPLFGLQWHLQQPNGRDINVAPAWDKGFRGKGVVVTVVDDGIDYEHPDFRDNYDAVASYDFNGNDRDPFPNKRDYINTHGTRCCGSVAAARNTVCGVGVAPEASIGAVRMLDGPVTDAIESGSLGLEPQHIDIYTNSWGPNDDGATIEGPYTLTQKTLLQGAEKGRSGKGSIYLFASGNGGEGDDCNADGYVNSVCVCVRARV